MAEDLLLSATGDASGRLSVPVALVDAGLGGANLLELTLLNKVGLSSRHLDTVHVVFIVALRRDRLNRGEEMGDVVAVTAGQRRRQRDGCA